MIYKTFNPEAEGDEISDAVVNVGPLKVASANEFLRRCHGRQSPRSIFGNFFFQGECSILFADTNVGKSLLGVHIAQQAAESGSRVVYFDFELSQQQFALRYLPPLASEEAGKSIFNDSLMRAELDLAGIDSDNFEDSLISAIEETIVYLNADVAIIDNLTFLCLQSETGADAGALMLRLLDLKRRLGISMLVISHTPKRPLDEPLTQNSLAGSKRIANFADSIFALGRSAQADDLRYVKQIKCRNCALTHGADNVMVMRISPATATTPLRLLHEGYSREARHLSSRENSISQLTSDILSLSEENLSAREIASQLGTSKSTVQRVLASHKKQASPVPSQNMRGTLGTLGTPAEPDTDTTACDTPLWEPNLLQYDL